MKKFGPIILVFLGIVLALIIVEIAVRIFNIPPSPLDPLPIPSYRLSENPVIGFEYRPGYRASDEPYDRSHEGFTINRAGFRDYDYEERKPEGVYRIIVLGDSTTVGNYIALEKTYVKVLEILLNQNAKGGPRYEVLNMGVGGYHTLQEVETLRTKGLKYDPDLVIVTFCLNDFSLRGDGGVYERLLRTNHLSSPPSAPSLLGRFMRFSRLAFLLYHRMHLSKTPYLEWYFTNILKGQTPARAGFVLLSELQRTYGFSARIVILPEFNAFFDKYRSGVLHDKVFREAEGLPGLTVLDLMAEFARRDNNAREFSVDGTHLNEFGHRTMAEILLPMIRTIAGDSSRNPALGTGPTDRFGRR